GESTGERFYGAELLRLKGEVLVALNLRAEAEAVFRAAIDLSRRQEARLFELRSAISLCRLLEPSRRRAALEETLAPVCAWFADHAAPELGDARALLAESMGGMKARA